MSIIVFLWFFQLTFYRVRVLSFYFRSAECVNEDFCCKIEHFTLKPLSQNKIASNFRFIEFQLVGLCFSSENDTYKKVRVFDTDHYYYF